MTQGLVSMRLEFTILDVGNWPGFRYRQKRVLHLREVIWKSAQTSFDCLEILGERPGQV